MIQISNTIEINRPVNQVFDFLADPQNNPKWMPVESVKKVSSGDIGVGTKFKQKFELMGASYEVDCIITAFERNKKISFRFVAPIFKWDGEYLFQPDKDGTRLSAQGGVRLLGPFKAGEIIFASKIRRLINDTAPNLKHVLES
jgi:uncharacterized protein YndB with AHSA1/START domain